MRPGQRRIKDESFGRMLNEVDHLVGSGDEAADASEGFRERTDHQINVVLNLEMNVRPFASRPKNAGGVRVVTDQASAILFGNFGDRIDRADMSAHREDTFGIDQAGSGLAEVGLKQTLEVHGVVVREAAHVGERSAAHAHAFNQTGMVLTVEVHQVMPSDQRRDRGRAGQKTCREHQGSRFAQEFGQFMLERFMDC